MGNYEKSPIKVGKKCKNLPNTAGYKGENITKKSFLWSLEGLKSVKLVQILLGTTAKIFTKKHFFYFFQYRLLIYASMDCIWSIY